MAARAASLTLALSLAFALALTPPPSPTLTLSLTLTRPRAPRLAPRARRRGVITSGRRREVVTSGRRRRLHLSRATSRARSLRAANRSLRRRSRPVWRAVWLLGRPRKRCRIAPAPSKPGSRATTATSGGASCWRPAGPRSAWRPHPHPHPHLTQAGEVKLVLDAPLVADRGKATRSTRRASEQAVTDICPP